MSWLDRLLERLRRPTRPPVRPPEPPEPPPPTPDPPGQPDETSPPGGGGGRVIKVTDERDGELLNRGYSYWSQAWFSDIYHAVYVFAGHADGRPRFWRVSMTTYAAERIELLMPYRGTSEGWYWAATGEICLCDGPRLHRVNPFTGEGLVLLDISERYPGCDLWQAHSSDDGQTHSATVRRITSDGPFEKIGTIVQHLGAQSFYGATNLDESIVTSDGAFLVIQDSHENQIVDLHTGESWIIPDADRAVAHMDCGPSSVIGEADKPDPGACVLWDLRDRSVRVLFHTLNMGHVSERAGRCLLSDVTHISIVDLNGGGVTPLLAHGMIGDPRDYEYQVHANLSPCGRVAAWVSNAAGRMDLYLRVM